MNDWYFSPDFELTDSIALPLSFYPLWQKHRRRRGVCGIRLYVFCFSIGILWRRHPEEGDIW